MLSKIQRSGIVALAILFIAGSGCVYYNTFFWARHNFNDAEKSQNADREKQDQNNLSQQPNKAQSLPSQPQSPNQAGGQSQAYVSQVNAQQRTQYEDAIKKASKVLKYHPNSSWADDALWLIGKSYYNMGDYVLADRKFKELVTNYSKSKFADESYYFMGLCQINLGHNDNALSAFQSIGNTNKKSQYLDDALFAQGAMEMLQDNNEPASELFAQYLEKYPTGDSAAFACYNLGCCKDKLKDYAGAFRAYSQVKKYNPGKRLYFQSTLASATAALNTDSLAVGMKILENLADNQSYFTMSGEIHLRIAEGYYLQGNIDKAIDTYKEVTIQNPHTDESAEAYYHLGLIYQNDKFDLTNAKDAFSKAQSESGASEYRNLALGRSAQIAKLENYQGQLQKADSLKQAQEQEMAIQKLAAPAPKDTTRQSQTVKPDSLNGPAADTLLKTLPQIGTGDSIKPPAQTSRLSTDSSSAALGDSIKSVAITEVNELPPIPDDSLKHKASVSPESLSAGLLDTTSGASKILRLLQSDTTAPKTQSQAPPPTSPATHQSADDSAQIAKTDSIRKALVESGIETRYMLSELYVYELNRPDSALNEYLMISREYPNSPYAAKSLLAAARIEYDLKDTAMANGYLRQLLANYPRSPQAAEAAATLNSPIDISNNAVGLYGKAESLIYLGNNPDSAIALFKFIADQFPDLAPKASYAVAWILDDVIGVEDSSAYYAYDRVIKNYPQTVYADAASERLGLTSKPQKKKFELPIPKNEDSTAQDVPDSTTQLALGLQHAPPTKVFGQFIYPSELLSRNLKGVVLFKIKIDVAGKVSEQEIIGPSGEHAIDSAATVALLQTQFDVSKLDLMQLDGYFQYPIPFKKPIINEFNNTYIDQQDRVRH